jgi:uncharacterized membrane protein YgcG
MIAAISLAGCATESASPQPAAAPGSPPPSAHIAVTETPKPPPLPPPSPATRPLAIPVGDVHDNAGLFSPQVLAASNAAVADLQSRYHKQLIVESFAAVPPDQRAAMDRDRAAFFRAWKVDRAKILNANGVYVLICMDPKYVEVGAGRETVARGIFTNDDLGRLRDLLRRNLRDGRYDDALAGSVDLVTQTYAARIP